MKAEIGDYVKIRILDDDGDIDRVVTSKVIGIAVYGEAESYETASGWCVTEDELGIDDVLLPSEMEVW